MEQAASQGTGRPVLGVGMVGYSFMGAAHSQAWRTAPRVFDLPLQPAMAVLCGRDAAAVDAAAGRLGWTATETDWRALVKRDDVQLVDIAAPGDRHAEVAIAALAAGKHVLCEKPLANTLAEAQAMAAAAARAAARGVRSMVGFNYRRVPALALARKLVADGRIGRIHHVRASYLQDWLVDASFPLTWRLQRERAGSGALGDLGAHIVDLTQYLAGELIAGVSAATATFVSERPWPETAGEAARSGRFGAVTVDDAAVFTARLRSGALATFEATRFAAGRKNELRIELNGDRGSLAFDLERLNELWFYDRAEADAEAGFRRILVTEPDHPYLSGWWPPGHVLGWEHTFTHQVRDLVTAIATGTDPAPSFAEGLQVQRVLAAVERSAANSSGWTPVPANLLAHELREPTMPRPFTLFTGQWADLPLEEVCQHAREWGYDGLELACWGDHFEVDRALGEDGYLAGRHELLAKYDLKCWAISNHLVGQAVCDHPIDARHQAILPARIWGDGEPEGVRQRAAAEMADTARAAAAFGVQVVVGFTGSSIWHTVAMFPPVPAAMIDDGYADFARRWNPILDTFDAEGVRFAHEVHPSEIAYDFWTTQRALEAVGHRPAFGLNFDPSHFVWQDLDPVAFLAEYRMRIYHVDCKEARKRLDGRSGRLGSHLPWGDPRRGWDFVSAGRGDIRWEDIFRMLNSIGYDGPISVEWEDAGMDRLAGAAEAITFLRRFNYDPPQASFDAAFSSGRE